MTITITVQNDENTTNPTKELLVSRFLEKERPLRAQLLGQDTLVGGKSMTICLVRGQYFTLTPRFVDQKTSTKGDAGTET